MKTFAPRLDAGIGRHIKALEREWRDWMVDTPANEVVFSSA